ncbi:MAG: protein CrcB [Rhizobiales bacterium 63-7]|uniref:fluoride efflux transporter CrcB n=1 Tax=Rhizobium sp. YJ-22 TaxID=3037556 RepID=UPI00092A1901|nr:fluoride efflux transporter CrcB [Rhizobium sp. YJ-22]MBN9033919.1 fluoride efflux transporter CrcB [Hyphomicrobiales bacterium]MDG3575638.1 fluoride efflux transporter CrcB [Rhizobium sp. YJ-22]OJU67478.1 MAG: protein CrcB [Rhizobiales bacterium 63-7]
MHVVLVAAGGAVGSVARYLVGVWSVRVLGLAFPWGTLIVNLVGSFAIGLLAELIARRFNASMELRLLLVTGFLGGFTTFSAFSLDTIALYERGQVTTAAVYVLASVVLSLAATFAGMAAIRSLL